MVSPPSIYQESKPEARDSKEGLKTEDRVIILEFNSLPALTPATCLFHQAAEIGIKPMEFIDKIVELGLEKHQSRLLGSDRQKELEK